MVTLFITVTTSESWRATRVTLITFFHWGRNFSLIYKVKYRQFVYKHGECRPPPQDVQQLFEAWEKVKVVQPLLQCPLLRRDVSDDALASKPPAALRRHETATRRPQPHRMYARRRDARRKPQDDHGMVGRATQKFQRPILHDMWRSRQARSHTQRNPLL